MEGCLYLLQQQLDKVKKIPSNACHTGPFSDISWFRRIGRGHKENSQPFRRKIWPPEVKANFSINRIARKHEIRRYRPVRTTGFFLKLAVSIARDSLQSNLYTVIKNCIISAFEESEARPKRLLHGQNLGRKLSTLTGS